MSENTTRMAVQRMVSDQFELEEVLEQYLPDLSSQRKTELFDTVVRMVRKAVELGEVIATEGSPIDVMTIYNAGVSEGFVEGRALGYEEGFLDSKYNGKNGE
jgi:hypothetical protein